MKVDHEAKTLIRLGELGRERDEALKTLRAVNALAQQSFNLPRGRMLSALIRIEEMTFLATKTEADEVSEPLVSPNGTKFRVERRGLELRTVEDKNIKPIQVGREMIDTTEADAVEYADYILNHYSRSSYADKVLLGRDLQRHGWQKRSSLPWRSKDALGWPIETFTGKPVKSAIRIICQNIRKVICKEAAK